MSMFNKKGELNTSSIKDALQTLVKYASILEKGQGPINLINGTKNHDFDSDDLHYTCSKCGYTALIDVYYSNTNTDFPSCEEVLMQNVLKNE